MTREEKECGSATVLCLLVFVPFLFLLLATTLEVGTFLQSREAVREVLDQQVRSLLRSANRSAVTEGSVRMALKPLSAMVGVERVSASRDSQQSIISISASYRPKIAPLFLNLAGLKGETIPFELTSRARRVPSDATIIFDRFVPIGADPCRDPNFEKTKSLVINLVSALRQVGVARITLATIPSSDSVSVIRVAEGGVTDSLPRCGVAPSPPVIEWSVGALQGAAPRELEMLDVAMGMQEAMFDGGSAVPTTRQRLFIVTQYGLTSWSGLEQVLGLLEPTAASGKLQFLLKHIAVLPLQQGVANPDDWERVSTGGVGVDSKMVKVDDTTMLSPNLVTAVVGADDVVVLAE
jgi:Flp pilus assembly protein TadG